jgi:hypothetical protein
MILILRLALSQNDFPWQLDGIYFLQPHAHQSSKLISLPLEMEYRTVQTQSTAE